MEKENNMKSEMKAEKLDSRVSDLSEDEEEQLYWAEKKRKAEVKVKQEEGVLEGGDDPNKDNKDGSKWEQVQAEDIAEDRRNRGFTGVHLDRCFSCQFVSRTLLPENCEWSFYGRHLVPLGDKHEMDLLAQGKKNKTMRRRMVRYEVYTRYTWLKYGILGKDNRFPVPTCIEAEIKRAFPDPRGRYSFFKKAKKVARREKSPPTDNTTDEE
ncbi:MAG: hypothetical protein SGBAC_013292 [Bacillariaceae sp.]